MTYRHSKRTKNSVHVSISSKTNHELHEPRIAQKISKNVISKINHKNTK